MAKFETVTSRGVLFIKYSMKKELTPEQLKIVKAIRVMINVAKRILESERKSPGNNNRNS